MRSNRSSAGWEKASPYMMLAPFIFFIVIFFGYAFLRTLYFSFTNYNMFSKPEWVGLKNYIDLFRNVQFGRAFRNSVTFAIIVTFFQTVFALILAIVLNTKIRGIKFFRALYYMPSVTSSVVITLIFMWLFQRNGIFNYLTTKFMENKAIIGAFFASLVVLQILMVVLERARNRPCSWFEPSFILASALLSLIVVWFLQFAGVVAPNPDFQPVRTIWLNTRQTIPQWAGKLGIPRPLVSIMILNTWTTAPTMMLLFLAGLQDIPRELYEAAAVDGATGFAAFRHITLPGLKHVTYLVVTMGLIGTLQMFDQVAIIGDQAPLESVITLAYFVYHNAFPGSAVPRIGAASAAAMVLAAFTLILTWIQRKLTRA
ncbi:MAG TPA: sugar ABC transporter permease [Firmicutes bacterium]|jgi:multiple sugar transport system permease protein|nr:sugar ABC transporter permease [Bacillota bacterium]NLH88595.1 sugar ABC transporter permease [Bacillota bacterium]HAN87202.1 sugar ABC transporter permease [Bacillota bacterium]